MTEGLQYTQGVSKHGAEHIRCYETILGQAPSTIDNEPHFCKSIAIRGACNITLYVVTLCIEGYIC